MAETVKQINRLKTRQDFTPGVVVYDMKRSTDMAYFIDKLLRVNYKNESPEFLDLPEKIQDEVDQGTLRIKNVPGRLLLPADKEGLSPRLSEFSARIIRPDISLTGFEEDRLELGKVITVALTGKARFFRQSGRIMIPVSSNGVDRRFTFFTLRDLPGVLEIGFGPLNIESEVSSVTAEEVAGAEDVLARRLAIELARDASNRLKGLKMDAESLRHPLPGGYGAGRSRSSRSRH